MRRKKSSPTAVVLTGDEVPYRLDFASLKNDGGLSGRAKLTSPLLDRAMHGRRGVDVTFASVKARRDISPPVLDPFEIASLRAYLSGQTTTRLELQRELDGLLVTWDPDLEIGRGDEVWRQTKIAGIEFAPRTLATPKEVRQIKAEHSARKADHILKTWFDTPSGRHAFTIGMTPAWAEHLLLVFFRNGKAMELLVEG